MHNALSNVKRHLRYGLDYSGAMTDPAERLKIARLRAGFDTAKEAAESLGFPVSTYIGHENGNRGYPAKRAFTYARKFKVSEQWLLYGTGKAPGTDNTDTTAEIINIIERLPALRRAEALAILRVLDASE
jgi:hypothetical protein